MLLRNLEEVSEPYLDGLCSDKAVESQTLDFKLELSVAEDRRELHKDLCSFANSDGGDLVYGVAQTGGSASKVVPIPTTALDGMRRRIAQALDSIEPRLQGVRIREVPVTDGYVVVARVPSSIDGPHSYRVDGSARRFVVRNGTDTTDMNFEQIRTAFDRTATLAERARQFIDRRIDAVANRKTWKPFAAGPISVVAVVPLAGLAGRNSVDIAAINNNYNRFMFRDWVSVNRMMNLDGLVVFHSVEKGGKTPAYT